jgi:hypothetical protein
LVYRNNFSVAAACLVTLCRMAAAQVGILQIQIVEGEGAVHAPGLRSARPLTVAITDETGKPVLGAAVSFLLPDDGPGGIFGSGLRTEVATTDALGRASMHAVQFNRVSGRFQIRIVASKEQARAGTVSFQYIAEAKSGAANAPSRPAGAGARAHSRTKWIVAAMLVGGGAAAGILAGRSGGGAMAATSSPVTPASPALSIGAPVITVGKP